MRRSGRRETQKPIDTLKGSLWAGEEKKGRKLRCPSASKIVLKGISDKYPLAKAPKASLCFPRQVGPMRVQEPRGWCGHFAEGVVPGEDGLQCLGEARPSLGAPHPHVTCCRTPQSRWPPTPATEGASVPVGHTSEPDSTTLLGFRAPRIRRGRGTQVKRTGRAHGELQLPAPPPGSPSSAGRNRCLDAAEACTEDARCQRLRTEYVAQCLGRAAPGGCPRARCRRALRRFFARGPPALTHALLFCPCANAACAERRRQTFVPACAFSGPGPAPSCLAPLDACEHSRICRCGAELPGKGRRWGGAGLQMRKGCGSQRGGDWEGRGLPLTRLPSHRAGPASWPSRPPARPPPAPQTAACWIRPPAACGPTRASWVRTAGIRARAGALPGMPSPGWADYSALGVPPGTAVTPNYVDNASARVAPWCDCGASGNRREECEAFRGLFTRNRCLGEGPGGAALTAPSQVPAGGTLF